MGVTPITPPGRPAYQFFAVLDEHSRTMRLAIIEACEDFLLATLKIGVDSGLISSDQANELHRIAAGDSD